MDNNISNKEIENAVTQLEDSYGIKEPISTKKLTVLLQSGDIKEVIKLIASQYGLPIDINIINVPNNFREQKPNSQFYSTQLSTFHPVGLGNEGIIAQVTIPGNLPKFGSPALDGFKIDVRISENCKRNPIVFLLIMAHELSHVFLHSCNHSQKDNEFFTDINAILQGFLIVFQSGRKIIYEEEIKGPDVIGRPSTKMLRTTTTTYGYLSDSQFVVVHRMLKSKIESNRLQKKMIIKEIAKLHKALKSSELDFEIIGIKHKHYLKYISTHTNKHLTLEKSNLLAKYFQPGFLDEFYLPAAEIRKELQSMEIFIDELSHYTLNKMNQLSQKSNIIKSREAILKVRLSSFKASFKALNKFVNVFGRIRILLILSIIKNKKYYFR